VIAVEEVEVEETRWTRSVVVEVMVSLLGDFKDLALGI
jgi:hypothetical protein